LPRSGIEYWNDIACSTFTQLRVDPLGRPFRAELSRANVGDMRVAVANSTGSIVTRSSEQVARSRQAYFLLHLQLGGVSLNRQDGREIQLARGDFAIFDIRDLTRWCLSTIPPSWCCGLRSRHFVA